MTDLKPCPNPRCRSGETYKSALEYDKDYYITCAKCGTASAFSDSPEEAMAAWDSLPRETTAEEAREILGFPTARLNMHKGEVFIDSWRSAKELRAIAVLMENENE